MNKIRPTRPLPDWNGKGMEILKIISVNGYDVLRNLADYTCSNVAEGEGKQQNDFSFNLRGVNVKRVFRPYLNLTYATLGIELYNWLLEQVNQPTFIVRYFDYSLGQVVEREMFMENSNRDRLYVKGENLLELFNVTFAFKSVYAYENYDKLRSGEPIRAEVEFYE